jgi:hypothetical protein
MNEGILRNKQLEYQTTADRLGINVDSAREVYTAIYRLIRCAYKSRYALQCFEAAHELSAAYTGHKAGDFLTIFDDAHQSYFDSRPVSNRVLAARFSVYASSEYRRRIAREFFGQ